MFKGKSILGLITARGGSKGIPRKNVKELAGKPLIQWTIESARDSVFIDRLVVTSDSEEILSVSRGLGCETIQRPSCFAQDESSSMEAILHAIEVLSPSYDYLILLQPTSPLRKTSDIDGILESAITSNSEIMVSVSKLKTHPMFIYEIHNGYLRSFQPQKEQLRRQDMPPVYVHNGALYVAEVAKLKAEKSFNGPTAMAYVTDGLINLDIDTLEDWKYAEFLIEEDL